MTSTSLLTGCSTNQTFELSENRNVEQFFRTIESRDLGNASKFAINLKNSKHPRINELYAQYYLLTCQPKHANERIKQLPLEKRNIYEATLYSLISVSRKSFDPTTETNENTTSFSKIDENELIQKKLIRWRSEEIWYDEWANLHISLDCNKMPLVESPSIREKIKNLALKKFLEVPLEKIIADFSLISLAIDVGYRFENPQPILTKHILNKDSPYYKYLEQQSGDTKVAQLIAKKSAPDEIEISELKMVERKVEAYNVSIPILIQ